MCKNILQTLENFQNGDIAAFEIYFNRFKKSLVFFAQAILKHHDELAEEIVSDSFIKLWHRRETIENEDKLKAFLYIITKNACLTFLKSAHATKCAPVASFSEEALIGDPEIYAHLIRAESLAILSQEIAKLSSTQQKVVQLSYENCDTKEISEQLKMTPNAVYVNYARAIRSLRKKLQNKKDWLF